MKTYYLRPSRKTLHGSFSKDMQPILTISSGDSIQYNTLDALWGLEPFQSFKEREIFPSKDKNSGHALIGPISIVGAEPGMTLAVSINKIKPATLELCRWQ